MRRCSLGVLALVLVALPFLAIGDLAGASAAPRRPSVDQLNERGFDELNACLSTRQRVDALYVLDVSGSLQFNDPNGRRFDALEASVAQLGTLTGSGTRGMEVNVAVATFGNGFTPPAGVHDWGLLPAGGSLASYAADVRREAEVAWQAAGTNQGTNYEAALDGAARVMRGRGSTGAACQMVLWFTDGLFSLGDPYDRAATDAASARMCARGGTLDRLRQDGVTVIGLALTGDDIEVQLARPEYRPRRGELAAMALSQSADKLCGTAPVPPNWRPGIYLSADEPAILGALFSGVAAQASGCVPSAIRTTLPARFQVDAGVGRFQVDLSLADASQALRVRAQGQQPIDVATGATSYAGAKMRLARAGGLVSLQVVMGPSAARGEWAVSGPRSRPTSISFYRCSDLRIEIQEPEHPLPGGDASTVSAVVTNSTGSPVDLGAFRGFRDGTPIDATSTDARVVRARVSDAGTGQIEVTLTPPEDRLTIDLALAFVPALQDESATQLSPVIGSTVLQVSPPGSFPTISPTTELELGVSRGLDAATGAWTVTGSSQGRSRVCFGQEDAVDAPAEAGDIDLNVSVECQDLAKNESIRVNVSARPEGTAEGVASARVPVSLENADGDQIREDLGVNWKLERQVDQGLRSQILAAALAIALLVPLWVLALVNFLLARFRGGDVRFGSFAVEVSEDGDLRPLEPIGVRGLMTRYIQGSERRCVANVGPGVDLVALTSRNPLGSPRFVARSSAGVRVVSGDGPVAGRAMECEVTPGLGAVWALILSDSQLLTDDALRPTPAMLLLVTREEGQDQIDRLVTRARVALAEGRWARTLRDLQEIALHAVPRDGHGAGEAAESVDGLVPASVRDSGDEDPFGLGHSDDPGPALGPAGRAKPSSSRPPEPSSDETYEDPFA